MKQWCARRWATDIRASARPVWVTTSGLVLAALLPLLALTALTLGTAVPSGAVEESGTSRSDERFGPSLTEMEANDAETAAARRMLFAIDAIAELGGFDRPATPRSADLLVTIRNDVPSDGLDEFGYAQELELFVDDMIPYLEAREAGGAVVSNDLWDAIDDLDDVVNGRFDPLAAEPTDSGLLPPEPWIRGLADLLLRNGAPLDTPTPETVGAENRAIRELIAAASGQPIAIPDGPPGPTPTPVDEQGSDEAGDEQADVVETGAPGLQKSGDAEPPVETGPNMPLVIAGGALAIASTIGAAVQYRHDRRPRRRELDDGGVLQNRSSAPDIDTTIVSNAPSVVELLDASRRMSSTLDATAVAETALKEVKELIAAYGGLVVRRSADGELDALHCDPVALYDLSNMEGSVVDRVAQTGRATAAVASDDPVLIDTPMAVAAAPIISEGSVTGVIMVVRHSTRPFDRDELDALELFAPLVGSAFTTAETHQSATHLVDIEPLTGLLNRRRLDIDLAAITPDEQVAYLMVDVDHFKNFNDTNGHAAGDVALKTVADTLQASVRPTDLVYRYGGEEFCVLLPGATAADAAVVAERARAAIADATIPGMEHQPEGRVTVSVGVSDSAWAAPAGLIENADAALYESKRNGRNQVTIGAQ